MANDSSNTSLQSYNLFNATDIKSFLIQKLSNSDNPVFSGCSYLGSNMNAIIDTLSVMLQQILFHYSVQTSQAAFVTANLFESINKLVSILNYKIVGKQTSMLPVRFTIDVASYLADNDNQPRQMVIPKFTQISYNSNYYLKNEIIIPINQTMTTLYIDSVMFQGNMTQTSVMEALGDQFETFILRDGYIKNSESFISDNFFTVYVDYDGDGKWKQYTQTISIFDNTQQDQVFQRRFNQDMNYQFKFGNGVYGKKLKKGSKVIIFYLVSGGERNVLQDQLLSETTPVKYISADLTQISNSAYHISNTQQQCLDYVTVKNTGGGTVISYPQSVQSIRANAPKIFSSQNRLFSLNDFRIFINKNFGAYVKDSYICNNDQYITDYLKYYYNIGIDCPQKDARVNIAQVQFMTSTNFNNVYCFVLPKVNTVISDTVPNYLNTAIKQQIVDSMTKYKSFTHNVVIIDPIYMAVTFGSEMDDQLWNPAQLQNRLVIVKNKLTNYSYSYIKQNVVNAITQYFNGLKLGDTVNVATISGLIMSAPGVKNFYIKSSQGKIQDKLTLYCWNPLYINQTNVTTQQSITLQPFMYPYFYNLKNIQNLIDIEDE